MLYSAVKGLKNQQNKVRMSDMHINVLNLIPLYKGSFTTDNRIANAVF